MPTTPTKVLHVCKSYLPIKGGIQQVVRLLTQQLHTFKHSVLTTGEDGAVYKQDIDSTVITRCRSYAQVASMPLAPSLVLKLIRSAKQYDLIAVHYPFPLADLGLSLSIARTPIIVHWHSKIVAQRRLRWVVAPFTLILFLRSASIIVTDAIMIEQSAILRLFRRKVKVIPYGMDSVVKTNKPKPSTPYLVLVGRHVAYKGIDIAIKALQNCNANLKVIGDGPLFERHLQLIQDLNLESRIELVQHASDEQVVDYISASLGLVVASTSENEAFALVQLEAMRLAKPIINTQLNSTVPHVARHQKEAITVLPRSATDLAAAMQHLIDQPELAIKLGMAGKERFDAKFSAAEFGKKIAAEYQNHVRT